MSEPIVALGKIIPPAQPAHRDAVHVAVLPVVADQDLSAGDRVGVRNGRASRRFQPHIGVVDPFLTDAVLVDQRCYVCLFPGTVTGMRHHWTHPSVHDHDVIEMVPAGQPMPDIGPAASPLLQSDFVHRAGGPHRPYWRTDTVIKLCQQMRQDDDYTALPALADALDEADYPNVPSGRVRTEDLRAPDVSKHQARRMVALLFSPETAVAVRAMEAMVDRMNGAIYGPDQNAISFDFMLEAGDKWRLRGEYTVEEGTITWSQALWGMGEEYWAAYEAITGQTVEEHYDAPFTCHC